MLTPQRVAEMLILWPDLPRPLLATFGEATETLVALREQFGRDYECARLALAMYSKLRCGRIADIFAFGLHEYLTEFTDANIKLGGTIARDFFMLPG